MVDKWASLISFKPSAGLDEGIAKTRQGQRANLHKMGVSKKSVKESINRAKRK